MRKYFVGICVVLFFSTAYATTWYVHPDSVQNCIDDCLDSCSIGDTVLVGPGTYYENIVWPDMQGIKLISEAGPPSTIVDGDSAGRVIAIAIPMDTTTQIKGFTIQNGYTTSRGGGIMLSYASPIISDNIITMNGAYEGGGIYLTEGQAIIRNNEITNNYCDDDGGGIYSYYRNKSIITNNIISNNTAGTQYPWDGMAGGILCRRMDSSYIAYNTITMNTAYAGGGIMCWDRCGTRIIRNTITENTTPWWGAGIECYDHSHAFIHKNTISANTSMRTGGIDCLASSSPFIDSCRISSNTGDGVTADTLSEPVLRYNNIHDNTNYGVNNYDSRVTVDAEDNWWGDASGPGGEGPGSGDEVSLFVNFDPWLTDSMEWVGVEEHSTDEVAKVTLSAYPNPFRDATSIRYEIRDAGYGIQDHSIQIYDISGRLVKSFDPLPYAPSSMQISWDGTDQANRQLPSGVYILRVTAGEHSETQKLLLIR